MRNILITGPSLDESVNISGISSLTKVIIANNSAEHQYFHFQIGRKDAERKGVKWFIRQLLLVPRFISFIIKHRIDFLHLNTDLTPASIYRDFLLVLTNSLLLKKKSLLHIHGGYLLMSPPPEKSLLFFAIKYMLKNQSERVVLSELERVEIERTYNIDCSVMPNAVATSYLPCDKDFSGKLTFVFMGRAVRSKGIFSIAKCLSEMKLYFDMFDFQVYGAGPDLDEFLRRLSAIKGLNYKYHGIVKGEQKDRVFSNSHIFLLPSLFGEGLPIAMLESMNAGCVPLVSDDASIGTVVKDGYNGFLIPKGSESALKKSVAEVFGDRNQLSEFSRNARDTIATSYRLEDYITNLNKLYKIS